MMRECAKEREREREGGGGVRAGKKSNEKE